MTEQELAAIEAKAAAATPGRMSRVKPITARYWTIGQISNHRAEPLERAEDWDYAEVAWVAVPALVAEVRQLRALVRGMVEDAQQADADRAALDAAAGRWAVG